MAIYILIAVLVILVIAGVVLYFIGRRMQRKQNEAQVQLDAMKQTVSMLIIDKKILRVKQSGLPQQAIDQVPWYMKRSKMPIVKAKVGPRIMTLVAEKEVWDVLPVKAEVKVVISGIYITAIKSVRGGSIKPAPKKKGIVARIRGVFTGKKDGGETDSKNSGTGKSKKKK